MIGKSIGSPIGDSVLNDVLAERAFSHALHDDDRKQLLRLARGKPGRLVTFVDLLNEKQLWREGRVQTSSIDMAVTELVLRRYLAREEKQ